MRPQFGENTKRTTAGRSDERAGEGPRCAGAIARPVDAVSAWKSMRASRSKMCAASPLPSTSGTPGPLRPSCRRSSTSAWKRWNFPPPWTWRQWSRPWRAKRQRCAPARAGRLAKPTSSAVALRCWRHSTSRTTCRCPSSPGWRTNRASKSTRTLEGLGGRSPVDAVTSGSIDDVAKAVFNVLGVHVH